MIKKLLCAAFLSISLITSSLSGVANAQPAVPIQTFSSSYKGYNTGTDWMSWLTPAQRCSETRTAFVAQPAATGKYPLLVYLHGTFSDLSGNVEGQQFAQRAASQGFVAVALSYNSSSTMNETGINRHAYCMFGQSQPNDVLSAACALPQADCAKGLYVAGFSQGAAIAVTSKNYNPYVSAVWAIGLSAYIYPSYKVPTNAIAGPGGTRALSNDKLVINMGQSSNTSTKNLIAQDMPSLQALTGKNCSGAFNCLSSTNGSGYYVVQNSEVADKVADHCYWQGVMSSGLGCSMSPTKFDPGFELTSISKWSMLRNLDWLRSQTR